MVCLGTIVCVESVHLHLCLTALSRTRIYLDCINSTACVHFRMPSCVCAYEPQAYSTDDKAFNVNLETVPTIYFPSFYALKAVVEGRPLVEGDESAASRLKAEGWECLKANWSIWIPAQIFNFTFVPMHLRIPFVSTTSFGWTVVLSTMQGAFDSHRAAPS